MLEQLKELITNYIEVDASTITLDTRFIEDLGFDSFAFMSMVGELEDTFDIEVDERSVIQVKTVGDAIDYITKLQNS